MRVIARETFHPLLRWDFRVKERSLRDARGWINMGEEEVHVVNHYGPGYLQTRVRLKIASQAFMCLTQAP